MKTYGIRIVALSLAIVLGCALSPVSERLSETAQRTPERIPATLS